jgi:opine dehydrogenase
VNLWSRSETTVRQFQDAGGVRYEGVLGKGLAKPKMIASDLGRVTERVDAILVTVPSPAHREIAGSLAQRGRNKCPILLNPGHTGGALEFSEAFRRFGKQPPPIAECSTLTYVARKTEQGDVNISGTAKRVWVAALPGGADALAKANELYPTAVPAKDVLFTGLCNVNMVLHPPGAVLGASWIENTAGNFTFYVQGLSEGVGRVMEALDAERCSVGAAYGHSLPSLFEEMQAIGTIEPEADQRSGLRAAVRQGRANRNIRAPDSLSHRYYREDFWYGLKPFLVFAAVAGVETPVANSLMTIAECLTKLDTGEDGRTASTMGIEGMGPEQLMNHIAVD